MSDEVSVSSKAPMPRGYAFLPKGSMYRTLHARRLTRATKKTLFIVFDPKSKTRLGLRVPLTIIHEVERLDHSTKAARLSATNKRDATLLSQARGELRKRYPSMPPADMEQCLKQAFRKASGRVGRTQKVDLGRRVELAVVAHVRHAETEYDGLLREGVGREEARKQVWGKIGEVVGCWRMKSKGK
ncbi:hypothetical protein K432DRAFT_381205 [Lepidopterella palustris CBS 459.81]|uniref:DUF2293 domain-containing protein n=1 Tax=Lepidopterella palustris CBS 459.81 TaxID=1314670 RepID=A0A8E2ECY3_9PEZI|nr:hypothetical protein K432DRAFT_381205 [Lepidopterella palustris CBS 459.81]